MCEKIRIGILDDELQAVNLITTGVKAAFEKKNIAVKPEAYYAPTELLEKLKTRTFDILFLDISMPKMDGIELGKEIAALGNGAEIIYVSSREDRMYDAFSVQPFGFVRKSSFESDLNEVIDRYLEKRKKHEEGRFVGIQEKKGMTTIEPDQLIYVENYKNFQILHLASGGERKIYSRMEILAEKLESYDFVRVHKGYMVNCNYICYLDSKSVKLKNDMEIPVGRSYQGALKEQYLEFLGRTGVIL